MTQPPYPPPQGGPPPPYGYGPQYPYSHGRPNYGPPPENHLVLGILATVFCCLPFGIVSIIKANQVTTLWAQGLLGEAQKSADDAKRWAMWGAVIAIIGFVLYIVFMLVIVLVIGVKFGDLVPS